MDKLRIVSDLHLYSIGILLQLEAMERNINCLNTILTDNHVVSDFDSFIIDYKGLIEKIKLVDNKLISLYIK
jgi:hypothetical protein